MANAFLNLAKTTRLPLIYRLGCAKAGIPTDSGTFNLASTDAHEQEVLVYEMNECQRQLIDEFPQLNVTSASLAITSGTRYTVLPADLRDTDIYSLKWNDGGNRDGVIIPFKSRAEIDLMGTDWLSDDAAVDYPEYAVLAWEQATGLGKIDWYKMPGEDRTATMIYRATEYQFVVADLTLTDGENICSVPDRMIPLLAIYVAIAFCGLNASDNRKQNLIAERDRLLSQWHQKLGAPMAAMVNAVSEFGGHPKTHDTLTVYTYPEI